MKKLMQKRNIVLLLLLIIVLTISAIPSEAASSQKTQVKKTVTTFFNAAKKYNVSKMKSCFVNPNKAKLFEEKIYMQKLYKSINKKITYKIKSVNIKGKTATVKVQCKHPYLYYVHLSAFDDVVAYLYKHPDASSAQVDKYQYNRTLKYYKKYPKEYFTETITIKLKKSEGKWKIEKWTNALSDVVHAAYHEAYNEYFD